MICVLCHFPLSLIEEANNPKWMGELSGYCNKFGFGIGFENINNQPKNCKLYMNYTVHSNCILYHKDKSSVS